MALDNKLLCVKRGDNFRKEKGMSSIHLSKTQGRIQLQLDAYFMGEDLVVMLYGGDRPHLGTLTAGARLEPLQTVQLQNHKEFYVTEEIAVRLRSHFNGNFVILCGTHLDEISKTEIKLITTLAIELGDSLITKLTELQH